MNFIDNIIGYIAPKAGVRRLRARAVMSIMQDQVRRYDVAQRGRRTNGLPKWDGSANNETALDLTALRAASRHMVRNNPYAKKAIQSIVANTVGTGIQPSPTSSYKNRTARVKQLWKKWAETTACDFDGQHNIYGIQRLVMRTVAEGGECIVLRRRSNDKSGQIPIQLQVLEADFLDQSKDVKSFTRSGVEGGYITQGVEFDKDGKRKGYWLFNKHPGEFGHFESRFVDANDVLHIYEVLRPGQVRGVPFGTSAMLRLKDFDDYEDAEVVRQKIAACFAAFVQDADPASSIGGSTDEDMLERLEPGVIEHLPPGKTINFASPPTTQNYDGFSRKILQGIAAGYGITYEALTGDLSNVNFSSGRMGWLEMHRQIEDWQYNMLIPMFCDKAWEWFMDGASLAQSFNAPEMTVSWTPPRRAMIDPVKETNAMNAQVRNGFKSYSEAVRELGYEPDEVIAELKEDMSKIKDAGLVLDCDGSVQLKAAQGTQQAPPAQ